MATPPPPPPPGPTDPLERLQHALAGLAAAVALSVPTAALLGRWLGDWWGDSYEHRLAVYLGLLVYMLVGAVVLYQRVARFETRRLSAGRALRWWASLWLWPLLLALSRRPPQG